MSDERGPAVTVVIPAYKAERTVARAIDSVLAQRGCTPSVIVVIDGSVDATEELLADRYGARVRVIVNERNRGVQFSRNAGLAATADEWVMFLDADDFVEGPLLRGLVDAVAQAEADLGFGPMQVFHERGGKREPVIQLTGSDQELFVGWLGHGRFVGCCSVLWRTISLRRIGGWDPALTRQEDGEAVLRAMLLGARVARSVEGCGVYVMHHSPDRLTRRSDNLASLLDLPAKMLTTPSTRFPRDVVTHACARAYYASARECYTRGAEPLGDRALRTSRELGFHGHAGIPVRRWSSAMLGLRNSGRLERLVRRLVGKAV